MSNTLTLDQKRELVLAVMAQAFKTYGLTMNKAACRQIWLAVHSSVEEGVCSKSFT